MKINLNEISSGPVYAQVRQQIESQIKSQQITTGEALPSPNVLARELSVDRGEIQRAYFELEHLGLIKKETSKDFLGHAQTVYRIS